MCMQIMPKKYTNAQRDASAYNAKNTPQVVPPQTRTKGRGRVRP